MKENGIRLATEAERMTSLEIAAVTGKLHKHVMEAIRKMEPAWLKVNGSNFRLVDYTDSKGEHRPCYALSKMECLYIATKFNDEARAKLVLRWQELERTRLLFAGQYHRFCIRNILKEWFGACATDDFIWEVCNSIVLDDDQQVYGYDALPRPKLYPRKHREFLRALVSVVLGIGIRKVSLRDLDAAYSIAFPNSTPINVNKKKL